MHERQGHAHDVRRRRHLHAARYVPRRRQDEQHGRFESADARLDHHDHRPTRRRLREVDRRSGAMLVRWLPALVAAGIVAAGTLLWRVGVIRRLRWIVAGLTTYGALAFAHAA